MLTIPDYEEIAKDVTEQIAREFAEFGFKAQPPVVTSGIVRAVIEATEQYMHLTGTGIEYLKRQPTTISK